MSGMSFIVCLGRHSWGRHSWAGIRGGHGEDEFGLKVREKALLPASEEEVANIVAFICALGGEYPREKGR